MPNLKTVTFDASQWQLVPKVPTEDMIINGSESEPAEGFSEPDVWEAFEQMSGCQQAAHKAKLCYLAMLAAAPTPAAQSANKEPVAKNCASDLYDHMLKYAQANGFDSITDAIDAARNAREAVQSAGQEAGTFAQGIEAAAKWLEKRAADYADEFGSIDPDTGTLEFGRDYQADIKHETHYEWIECAEGIRKIVAPVNGGERALGQVIDERDQYHDAAEKLADAIAKHFGVEIGEHSNLNCPWQNALDHIAQATKRAADAQQVGGDEHANRYRVEKASGGFWPNAVRCGTGTRELFVGHKKQCERVAAELKTAFEDGRFVERTAALTSPAKVGGEYGDAYQGAREDLAIWKKRALEAEELNRKFIAEINGPTHMGEPVKVGGDGLIEQHARDSAELRRLCAARDEARRTAEYWKANHLAGNAEIERLKKLLEAKVGGDEREAFRDALTAYALACYANTSAHEMNVARDRVRAIYDRAALSADGGERKDAERWRTALRHVGGTLAGGHRAVFTLSIPPLETSHVMRGSVAEHFTAAIDAAIAAKAKGE